MPLPPPPVSTGPCEHVYLGKIYRSLLILVAGSLPSSLGCATPRSRIQMWRVLQLFELNSTASTSIDGHHCVDRHCLSYFSPHSISAILTLLDSLYILGHELGGSMLRGMPFRPLTPRSLPRTTTSALTQLRLVSRYVHFFQNLLYDLFPQILQHLRFCKFIGAH
jgi:hypothetical protein